MTYQEQVEKEKVAVDVAVKQTIEACEQKARIDGVLAEVFDKHKCSTLYIEWTLEKFWGMQMPKLLKDLNKIYDACVERNITPDEKQDFNDMDDKIYYIPHVEKKILVHTGQTLRHLYVWEKECLEGWRELHIRRFYDIWTPPEESGRYNQFDKEEIEKFINDTKTHGMLPAINKADYFTEEYADDQIGNNYPHRLSLETYQKNNFEMRYGDGRDPGYVASWKERDCKVDWAIITHHQLKSICECYIPSVLCALFDDTDDAIPSTDDSVGFDSWPKREEIEHKPLTEEQKKMFAATLKEHFPDMFSNIYGTEE